MSRLERTEITDVEQIAAILREEGYGEIFVWRDADGSRYGVHTHPYREVRWVLEGTLVIVTEEGEFRLGPGDRLDASPLTPHSAYVIGETRYVCASRME
ncbi:cupin domain-containing protein [Nitratifractor sp.]